MHAQTLQKGVKVPLDGLNSTNGTFVNSTLIIAATQIFPSDLVLFATSEFRLLSQDDREETLISRAPDSDSFVVEEEINPKQAEDMPASVFGVPLEPKSSKRSVGRSIHCDFQVDMPGVSEYHANITFHWNRWTPEDNQSTNGLYQNGQKELTVALDAEPKVSIGQVEFQFSELKWDT